MRSLSRVSQIQMASRWNEDILSSCDALVHGVHVVRLAIARREACGREQEQVSLKDRGEERWISQLGGPRKQIFISEYYQD